MVKGLLRLHNSSPLVNLCKERKEFIKAAKYCRFDLVTSFVVYLDSLLELGNALNTYVEQELIICADFSSHNVSLSDFDDDSHLEFSSSDSESDLHSLFHGSHCDDEEESTSHFQESRSNVSSKNAHHSNMKNVHNHVTMSSDENIGHHDHGPRMSLGNRWEIPQSDHWFPQQENQQFFEADPMSFLYHNDILVHYGNMPFSKDVTSNDHVVTEQHKPTTTLPTPAPPPPPQVTTWDFLYPLSHNYNDVYYDHDVDLSQVREREGIPDLEDENETGKISAVLPPVFDEKEKGSGMKNYSVQLDNDHNVKEVRKREVIHDLEDECDLSSTVSSVFDEKEMESEMRHGFSGNATSNVTQLNPNEDALSTKGKVLTIWRKTNSEAGETNLQGRMSLKEAVLDIKNEFKHIFDCGEEFSSVIEVSKLPHHSISTKLKAFASCVLGLIIPSIKTCLLPSYMSYQPVSRPRKLSKADKRRNQEHVCIADLSSTLDMLYVLEKKLYGEVTVEEKIRIPYDKQYKRLKKLDDLGSEIDKIDDTLASIKLLHSEITVSVRSIAAISREIHELRDNKLLSELNKLIEGLFRLWKVMSTCHQKQFEAISKAKSHVHISDPENRKKSSSKTTLRLGRVFLKWGMCFSNFIRIQKAFLKNLNDWLQRHILHEPEESGDGVGPFSPNDVEAPPIFRICNDWYNAINKISEIGVSEAISKFALSLHQLYEKLEEEKVLKVTVKSLLKDYQHRVQLFCKRNSINCNHHISFINMKASENFNEDEVPLLRESDENTETLRKRLVAQRKRHTQVIRHVNDVASSCLQKGLPPIFEALGNFCSENLKNYEKLRLQNTK